MATIVRLTAISIFISRFRKPHPKAAPIPSSVNINDYIISGDELIEREGSWGFTPESLAQMKAAIQRHAESADADA